MFNFNNKIFAKKLLINEIIFDYKQMFISFVLNICLIQFMKIHTKLRSIIIFVLILFVVLYVSIAQIASTNILVFNFTCLIIVLISLFILYLFHK